MPSHPTPSKRKSAIRKKRRPVSAPVVCNLAAWFNAPDIGYQPYYGRKKRKQ